MKKHWILFSTLLVSSTVLATTAQPLPKEPEKFVIIYIWDGLRPDAVSPMNTPNLYRFMKNGVQFLDNHSSYPTFTMMNAASFATGDRAGKTGFFGNTLWHPSTVGNDSAGNPVDFKQPVFTEDYKILQALNTDTLLFANTLFNAAHKQNITTAVIGKSGPAFMQDYLSQGYALDEKHVYPLSFAKRLQQDGYPLPKYSPLDFKPGELILADNNGSPTEPDKTYFMADGVTPDPTDKHGSPFNRSNEYMASIYLKEILLKDKPQLSVIWMRNPDTTEHAYGPGSANYYDALRSNDKILGNLIAELKEHELYAKTDIIIVSDHAHSNVSGPLNQFPLRKIKNDQPGEVDANGYSVSGSIRAADLLTQAGFHAYDGGGCAYDFILSGIKRDGTLLHPAQTDESGKICGKNAGDKYVTKSYKLPEGDLPEDAIVVAANGGSDYFYVPSHNKKVVERLVNFLESHQQFDVVFVDGARYGTLPGAIPLVTLGLQNPQGRSPDVIVGLSYDPRAKVNGLPGIDYSDWPNVRGNHGSFSPIDVHNFLAASGPDFRSKFQDMLPTGNVDVAPTVAAILNLPFQDTDGRVLFEALKKSKNKSYKVQEMLIQADEAAKDLVIYDALNQRTAETQFIGTVHAKVLSEGKNKYFYFDQGKGRRY